MSMTTRELFEIVKDVPRDAWPYQMMFHARRQMFTNEIEPSPRWDLTDDWAELAFIGSMTAWLVSEGYHNFEYRVDDDNSVLVLEYGNTEVAVPLAKGRDSMVDALAAACKEAA